MVTSQRCHLSQSKVMDGGSNGQWVQLQFGVWVGSQGARERAGGVAKGREREVASKLGGEWE
jgi:hypothetical protein